MTKRKDPGLGFIFVTLILMIMGVGIIIPVLPSLVTKFEGNNTAAGTHWYGIIISSYSIMQFVAAPILGSLSDRFGRRRVILVALAGSAIDYLIMGFAPSLGWLFLARVISGATAGALATCNAYIADVTTPEKRAAGFGLVGAAFGIGFVLGPALGGFLGDINIKLPFFVSAGCVGINWLYGAFVLPESLPIEKRRAFSWKRANPIGSLTALKRFRGVLDLAWMYFIVMFGQVILQSIWAIYVKFRYGWTLNQIGLSLTAVGVLSAVVQGGLIRPILGRIGERRGLVVGLSLTALAFVGYGSSTHGWMVYCVMLVGAFGGLAGPATQALVTKHVPPDEQGAVQGSLSGLMSLASIFAPLVATASFGAAIDPNGHFYLPGIAFYEAAALVLFALVLAFASFRADDARIAPAAAA